MKGYDIVDNVIVVNRELTELDIILKDFLDILNKYSRHLVVSGFVSIATGRTRGTEDIDVLAMIMNKEIFEKFFKELDKIGFWCYQGDNADEIYPYIKEMKNIRFARKDEMFPNIEFIPINELKKTKYFEFTHPQKIRIKNFEFNIPPIEFEILYKEIILKGKKDIEDAKHLRTFFSNIINNKKFKDYETIIRGELK